MGMKTKMFTKNLQKKVSLACLMAVSITLGACGRSADSSVALATKAGSIVGGVEVEAGGFPSVVGITSGDKIICSGNLVTASRIMTAAHCVLPMDYGSQDQVVDMIGKVLEEVMKLLPAGSDFSAFSALSREDQRRLFKQGARDLFNRNANKIKIHFGNGVGSPMTAATSSDIVESVRVSEGSLNYAVASLIKNTVLGDATDDAVSYISKDDMATVRLKSPVQGVTPIPVISPDEHADSVRIGERMTLVGFGLKVDSRFVDGAFANVEQLTQQVAAELDATKKQELQLALELERAMLSYYVSQYMASGNKNKVEMTLENYDHEEIKLRRPGRKLEGACNGDSGGPVFVKNAEGQWRQMGVIVTVDYCGNTTQAAPLFD
jgi:hypothetical protein